MDGDAPDLVSQTDSADGDYGVGEDIVFTITWDEACIGTGSSLTISNGGSATYTSGSGTTALVYTYTVAEDDTSADDVTVTALAGTLADAAGGACANVVYDPGTIDVDGDAPDLVSVAAPDGTYIIGEVLTITVTWDEACVKSGTPTLTLSNGDVAAYSSGTGTTAIVFTTTIADGDTDSGDLQVSSYSGTLADAAGGACGAATGDLGAVLIDGDTPDITGADATNGAYGVGENLDITVTFDEAVTVTGTPTITLSNSDVASYTGGSTTTSIVFRTTIAEDDATSSDLSVSSIQATAGGATMKDSDDNVISNTITGGDLGTVFIPPNRKSAFVPPVPTRFGMWIRR